MQHTDTIYLDTRGLAEWEYTDPSSKIILECFANFTAPVSCEEIVPYFTEKNNRMHKKLKNKNGIQQEMDRKTPVSIRIKSALNYYNSKCKTRHINLPHAPGENGCTVAGMHRICTKRSKSRGCPKLVWINRASQELGGLHMDAIKIKKSKVGIKDKKHDSSNEQVDDVSANSTEIRNLPNVFPSPADSNESTLHNLIPETTTNQESNLQDLYSSENTYSPYSEYSNFLDSNFLDSNFLDSNFLDSNLLDFYYGNIIEIPLGKQDDTTSAASFFNFDNNLDGQSDMNFQEAYQANSNLIPSSSNNFFA